MMGLTCRDSDSTGHAEQQSVKQHIVINHCTLLDEKQTLLKHSERRSSNYHIFSLRTQVSSQQISLKITETHILVIGGNGQPANQVNLNMEDAITMACTFVL